MSRSRKKTPIFGANKAITEKEDKRKANRAFRRKANIILSEIEGIVQENDILEHEAKIPESIREVSDVWTMSKDGKGYWVPKEDNDWERKKVLDSVVNKPHWWNRTEQESWERMMRK